MGFEILHRNWRTPFAEIDLLARKGDELLLIEVKARLAAGEKRFEVGQMLSMRQRERLARAALWIWSQQKPPRLKLRSQLAVVDGCNIRFLSLSLARDRV